MRWLFTFCLLILYGVPAPAQSVLKPSLMDEAFQAAQWGFLSSAGSAIHQTGLRRSVGDDRLADLLRQQQSLSDLRNRTEADLAALGADITEAGRADATRLGGEIDALGAQIGQLDLEIEQGFPRFHQLTKPQALSIKQVQDLLQDDEGLVFAFTGINDSYVWAITPDRAIWHRVGFGRSLVTLYVSNIRKSLQQASQLRSAAALDDDFSTPHIAPFDRVSASILYTELLAPLEPYLQDVRHLFTVTDGPLSGLPLSLLVTDNVVAGSDGDAQALRQTGWFFQRHGLTTLPSIESLPVIRATASVAKKGRKLSFLGFGDPDLYGRAETLTTNKFFRSGGADLDSIRALAPLPNTRAELRQIAAILGAGNDRIYLGAAATETAVKAAPLASADVIAFATHGLLSGDLQGLAEPALVLSPPQTASGTDDGLLTASEISALELNAEWIVLSACNTAGGDGRPDAEGLSGLARAFLFAGARTIMVSHWPVRDDAAARLTTDTFAALAKPGAPRRKAEALQLAMGAMLHDETDPSLAHPAAWAPFILVGDGGY